MRREIVWAAVVGISFGLIIAFGVWRINASLTKSKPDDTLVTPIPQSPEQEFKITLNTPENNTVVTNSPVSVSGITRPLTWVVVSGETGDYILQSDEQGVFSQDVNLTPGVNQIKTTALDQTDSQTFQKILVVYSSSFQLKTPGPAADSAATGDAAINQKVSQKVAQALNQPKAYLGVVTDITNTTIQIKNPESQIEQISVGTDGITVVNTKGSNNKPVKLTDIAIGDFIVGMGYINSNQVLEAQRILIADPLPDLKLSVSFGKVTATTKNSLTVADTKSAVSATLTPDKSTAIAAFTNGKTSSVKITTINKDELVIYVTDISGTPPLLRSIFDIGKPQG